MDAFGTKIRRLREQAKKSMKELADAMNVSVVYISDIERGQRNPPQGDKLKAIADFLHLDFEEVQTWARRDRKRVELDLKGDGPISDAALTLARRWDGITEDEAKEIMKILKRSNHHDG